MAPARIEWAVRLLELEPTDRVLEFGCGPGVAASLVADQLTGGYITGIDRSPTAIARSGARNADHIAGGRLSLVQAELADYRTDQPFDKAFGVNVNVFWTSSAAGECRTLRAVLAPGAPVHLVYGGPGGIRTAAIDRVVGNLTREGFTTTVREEPQPALVCVSARLCPAAPPG